VVRILRTLKAKRDMSVNEARLIVSIEDPRTREQRQLGIEVSSSSSSNSSSSAGRSVLTMTYAAAAAAAAAAAGAAAVCSSIHSVMLYHMQQPGKNGHIVKLTCDTLCSGSSL
jgi:hypothetical protein